MQHRRPGRARLTATTNGRHRANAEARAHGSADLDAADSTRARTAHEHVFGEPVLEEDIVPGIPAYVRRCTVGTCRTPDVASAFAS